jgi:hypothetical protein
MATTTTNYGFDIPQSTDLVKDGATAIATLGQDIDTAMNTALGTKKAGMVLLNTTSFSGVASQALPANTFSATYENYMIVVNLTGVTSDGILYLKLRSGVTDSSAGYFQGVPASNVSGTATNFSQNNSSLGFFIIELDSGSNNHIYTNVMTMHSPFASILTTHTMNFVGSQTTGAILGGAGGGVHNSAVSYDSANLIASAGNVTGKVSVYGINS